MQKTSSWSELLKHIISNSAERERIAAEIGVSSITLSRWANGESKPRSQNLRQLLIVLPKQYHDQFQKLLEEDLTLSSLPPEESSAQELPLTLVNEVLATRASASDQHRFWAISRQVLQALLRQLDPQSRGMAITVVRCMPPHKDGKIHSLRESVGLGNAPWESDLEAKAVFLGAESLAGYATSLGRLYQIGDLRTEPTLLPAYQTEQEVSAIACPIMYASRVAGCLLLSSTQPEYFLSQARQEFIRNYTNLLAVAFGPEEFYPLSFIELYVLPSHEVQRSYFAGFRQQIAQLMRESANTSHPLSIIEAEQLAWQQIEQLLLHLPPQHPTNNART